LASFTCQWRDALMGRTQRNQWLAEFESGAGHLENPLFLADVTMPAKVFTAHHRDGNEQRVLAIVTTLELDAKGEHYKKRFVERLSDAARDYVRKSDNVAAFVLMNRPKDWRPPAGGRRHHRNIADAAHHSFPL